jgi:uncharacterized protein (TIGR03437 family)
MTARFFNPKALSARIIIVLVLFEACVNGQAVSFLAPTREIAHGVLPHRGIVQRGLATADFNGDGILDIVEIQNQEFTFPTISLGNGDGTFRPSPSQPVFPNSPAVYSETVTADFDQDGRMDVASISGGGIAVFPGNGDGTLRSPSLTSLHYTTPYAWQLFAADLDGDGKPDLIWGPFVLIGRGDGTFATGVTLNGNALLVADLNRDGRADILLSLSTGELVVALGNGDGSFRNAVPFAPPFPGSNFFAADFTGDGILDIAFNSASQSAQATSNVAVLPGRGDGSFLAAVVTDGVPGPIFAASDFNRDGRVDLLAGNSIMTGIGRGTFALPVSFGVTGNVCWNGPIILCDPPVYMALISGDFNGDGQPDVACAYRFEGGIQDIGYGISILRNDSPGDGLLVPGVSSATWRAPVSVGSLVSAFGQDLAPATEIAGTTPGPTTLGGVRVHITYRVAITNGVLTDLLAPLSYVSPTQINYLLPGDVANVPEGSFAFIAIEKIGSPFVSKALSVPLRTVSPGLFTLNAGGLAAATAVRVLGTGTQQPLDVSICARGICGAVPIDVTTGQVYLSLYGTGFQKSSLEDTTCMVGQSSTSVTYVGPQRQLAGLDQINISLPASLSGKGDVLVECTLGGNVKTNPVFITIQ